MGYRFFRPSFLAVLLLLAACAARAEVQDVSLSLANDSDRPLRCVAVIAHFMSQEWPAVAPGGRLDLALERDTADASLFLRSADGRRKPVENLLCGDRDDWSATRGEVPLTALRSAAPTRVILSCGLPDRLQCAPAGAGD